MRLVKQRLQKASRKHVYGGRGAGDRYDFAQR
jgi:hypothetical protein